MKRYELTTGEGQLLARPGSKADVCSSRENRTILKGSRFPGLTRNGRCVGSVATPEDGRKRTVSFLANNRQSRR